MAGGISKGTGLVLTRRVPEPRMYEDMHILRANIDYANISGLMRLPGASAAITIGATPPTANNAGTGLWIDRTGLYTLNSNSVGSTITSAGIKLYGSEGDTPVLGFWEAAVQMGSMYGYLGNDGYYYGQWDMGIPTGASASRGIIALNAYDGANTGACVLTLDGFSKTVGVVNILKTAGSVYIGDTANAKATLGLTVNQGAADDEAIALKSSDVAHGMIIYGEADTYGALRKYEATAGGLWVAGYKDADGVAGGALHLSGYLDETADTTKSTSGRGVVQLGAAIGLSTDITTVAAAGNLVAIRNVTTTEWICGGNGDTWQNGEATVTALKVGANQVVGARVVDARADDVANSGDATTDGLIDALRDAMIAHGLIAAA